MTVTQRETRARVAQVVLQKIAIPAQVRNLDEKI
jgi:hypothetical protein